MSIHNYDQMRCFATYFFYLRLLLSSVLAHLDSVECSMLGAHYRGYVEGLSQVLRLLSAYAGDLPNAIQDLCASAEQLRPWK